MWRIHSKHLSTVLGVFSIPMALGALFAWVWLPSLQTAPEPDPEPKMMSWPTLPSKTLERLAKGYTYANITDTNNDPLTGEPKGEDQRLGFRNKILDSVSWVYDKLFNGGFSTTNPGESSQGGGIGTFRVAIDPEVGDVANGQGVAAPQLALNLENGSLRQSAPDPLHFEHISN